MKSFSVMSKILISIVFIFSVAISQEERSDILENLFKEKVKTPITNVQANAVALEGAIDASKYFVGPSDVIAVNIWSGVPVNYTLTVTPEGTLIIPTVGEVKVSDITLSDVKDKIRSEVRKKYTTPEVTVTLVSPRSIVVSVVGNVLNPGLYTFTSIDRANKAIDEANKPTRYQKEEDAKWIIYNMSIRNIVLKHRNGSQDRVDITKFLATKDDKWNQYLREGDVIIVPRKNGEKNVIGIYGEVNAPGRYEFVSGDNFFDAIQIGQGFTRLAITDSIIFSRLNSDGDSLSTQFISYSESQKIKLKDLLLEPGDRIVVKARIDLREDYRVTIDGEVMYPGTYPITQNKTKLSEIIKQAGGFTEFASLKSAELIRRSIQPTEVETERMMSLRGGASKDDSADYYLETNLRLKREIVNVDFEKLFIKKDESADIVLQTNDNIIIPKISKTIYVFGQVVSPGHIGFQQGKNLKYYIEAAGGYTERARDGDVKIIKAKTKQWLSPGETEVEEGDYVWVPKEPERDFAYYMTVASQAASVMSVIVGIAVVIVQITK